MLELHPGGFFSRTITVTLNGHEIAAIKDRATREGAKIRIDGAQYKLSRSGILHGDYVLEQDGVVHARASKPGFTSRRMTAEVGGQTFDLVPDSPFRSTFRVEQFGEKVGSIGPRPVFRSFTADLPVEIAMVHQVFLIALVTLMWTRSDS